MSPLHVSIRIADVEAVIPGSCTKTAGYCRLHPIGPCRRIVGTFLAPPYPRATAALPSSLYFACLPSMMRRFLYSTILATFLRFPFVLFYFNCSPISLSWPNLVPCPRSPGSLENPAKRLCGDDRETPYTRSSTVETATRDHVCNEHSVQALHPVRRLLGGGGNWTDISTPLDLRTWLQISM